MTEHLRRGESNFLAVKVDNSVQPDVAPSGTDLYPLFGGIYRPVTIFSTSNMCIDRMDYTSSGVYVHPKSVSDKRADIEVEILIESRFVPVLKTTSKELLPPKGKEGQGLYAEYYTNPDFNGTPKHTRIDTEIDFTYGNGGPFEDNFKGCFTKKSGKTSKTGKISGVNLSGICSISVGPLPDGVTVISSITRD